MTVGDTAWSWKYIEGLGWRIWLHPNTWTQSTACENKEKSPQRRRQVWKGCWIYRHINIYNHTVQQGIEQNCGWRGIPSQHEISKSIVVDCGNLAANNSIENSRLIDINGWKGTEATLVISQQAVDTEQTHNAEVTQYFEHICSTMIIISISGCKSNIAILFLIQDLKDHWFLDQGLEVVHHSNNIPDLHKNTQRLFTSQG